MLTQSGPGNKPIVIKKYANRRLYNTETSAYVTLDDLCKMVKEGKDFVVCDAKTGQDLTCQILTQIIFEQESKGVHLLPINFLRSVIRFYDDNMREVLQHYLEASIKGFVTNQDRMRGYVGKTAAAGGASPFSQFEELTRQNVALFEKAFQMFTPFGGYFGPKDTREEEQPQPKSAKAQPR